MSITDLWFWMSLLCWIIVAPTGVAFFVDAVETRHWRSDQEAATQMVTGHDESQVGWRSAIPSRARKQAHGTLP